MLQNKYLFFLFRKDTSANAVQDISVLTARSRIHAILHLVLMMAFAWVLHNQTLDLTTNVFVHLVSNFVVS